jgi:hypothetical protein
MELSSATFVLKFFCVKVKIDTKLRKQIRKQILTKTDTNQIRRGRGRKAYDYRNKKNHLNYIEKCKQLK